MQTIAWKTLPANVTEIVQFPSVCSMCLAIKIKVYFKMHE